MRWCVHPGPASGRENPWPGIDGITRWKASAGSPPWARGSLSGPMRSMNSTIEPGQPWISMSGVASALGRAHVQEMDGLPVDGGGELGVPVQLRLGGAPVVLRLPVRRQRPQVIERYAAAPPFPAGRFVGPARARQPLPQIVDGGLRNRDAKRNHPGGGRPAGDGRRRRWESGGGNGGATRPDCGSSCASARLMTTS